jgi:hypothetical protein
MPKSISTQQTQANIDAVIALLTDTPARIARVLVSMPAAPHSPLGEGERSFTETLAHLINSEARSSEAIYVALLVDSPLLPDIHSERDWGALLRMDRFHVEHLMAYYGLRRTVLLRVLNGLTEAQWSRTMREAGKQRQESVYWRARSLALHELEHVTYLEAEAGYDI